MATIIRGSDNFDSKTIQDEKISGDPRQIATAWVNFDGTDGTIKSSYNINSIVREDTGLYTIVFENEMDNNSYALVGSSGYDDGHVTGTMRTIHIRELSTLNAKITSTYAAATDANVSDYPNIIVVVFGGRN